MEQNRKEIKILTQSNLDEFWAGYQRKSQMNDKHELFKGQSDDTAMEILQSKMQH